MRRFIIIIILITACIAMQGQGYGAQWVLSYNTSVLKFGSVSDTVGLDTIPGNMPMLSTDANICDTNGNLLFFTNGVYIADRNGIKLINGDSLSPCSYTVQYFNNGLGINQAALFLPKPGSSKYYYLIHFSNDTNNGIRPGTLYYSIIDAEGNSSLGTVVEKNVPFFKSAVLREGGLTACKHANGRDYWIVIGGHNDNTYYEFLVTPDSILGPYMQNLGPVYNSTYDWGYSKFSQDGSKYVTSCAVGLILVADFDRCSGIFSNSFTLYNNASTIPSEPSTGGLAEFSPNGRFIYTTNSLDLSQYDLWADTVQDSVQIWNDSINDFYKMDMLQVAPNGKIYGSTYNGGLSALHIINFPDLKGDSCGFIFGGQPTRTLNSSELPNMINYNLGALVGSGCDTIRTGVDIANIAENNLLRLMPNPSDKYLYVEMGKQGSYQFDLLNESGEVVDSKETRQVDNFDTERLASGMYFMRVIDKRTGAEFASKKVMVQH